MKTLLMLFALLSAAPAAAQLGLPGSPPVVISSVAVSTINPHGIPMVVDRGPWVIGDVRFEGYKNLSIYTLQNAVRARRGLLYTPIDLTSDLSELRSIPGVGKATAAIFGMANMPTPENYSAIAASTMSIRVLFTITEKEIFLPGLTKGVPLGDKGVVPGLKPGEVPVAQSGIVMTPTAYRGINQYNRPGLGMDINAVYFIGRLYGQNSLSTKRKNFIDRLGVWFLSVDGKMQLQSEGEYRPAISMGTRGMVTFRDAPQPTVNAPGVSVKIDNDNTRALSDGYLVMTKEIYSIKSSLGYALGNAGDRIGLLNEFMSPQFLPFIGHPNGQAKSRSVLFGSLMYLPKPDLPLAIEFLKPNGMVLNPILINFKIGYFLKLNFDIAYLKYQGGWDMLGMFQFRYTHFPRTLGGK